MEKRIELMSAMRNVDALARKLKTEPTLCILNEYVVARKELIRIASEIKNAKRVVAN